LKLTNRRVRTALRLHFLLRTSYQYLEEFQWENSWSQFAECFSG